MQTTWTFDSDLLKTGRGAGCGDRPNLYIMVGPAGCGKSTFAKFLRSAIPNCEYVSRDEIRNELRTTDVYFENEVEVRSYFRGLAQYYLMYDCNVIVDATHLTPQHRRWWVDNCKSLANIHYIFVDTPMKQAERQNAQREGWALVPTSVIHSMYQSLVPPTENENGCNAKVWRVSVNDLVHE